MSVINYVRRLYDTHDNDETFFGALKNSRRPFQNDASPYFTDNIRLTLSNGWFVCGHEKGYPGYAINTTSRFLYLHYVVSGKGTVNGMQFGANDIFVIRPQQKKHMVCDKEDPWNFYWCVWKGDIIDTVIDKLKYLESNKIYHLPETVKMTWLFNYLIYSTHHESRIESIVNNYTNLIITDSKQCSQVLNHVNKNAEIVQDIQNHIERKYATTNVTKISQLFHFDRKYLSYVFRETTGMTMQEYIQKVKLNSAANYLIDSPMSIETVSMLAGYNNYSTFIKAFKKEYSLTPSEFVKRNRE